MPTSTTINEVKASNKTKTKTGKKKKNGKLSPKKSKNKPKAVAKKKLPPSRRNEIWETLSDDQSDIEPTTTKPQQNGSTRFSNRSDVPKSRRNEIWESLSLDDSETPSSPTDVMVELEDWSDNEEDLKTSAQQSKRMSSSIMSSRVDMSGSIHSSQEFDLLIKDDDSLMDEDSIAEDNGLPAAPFSYNKKSASKMSLKELKAELRSYNISPEHFLEKIEMIKAVKDARRGRQPQSQTADTDTLRSRSRSVSIVSNTSNTNRTTRSLKKVGRFAEQESVLYTSSNGTPEVATILKIHLDDDLVPFYDIRLKDSGKEKQTDDSHLSPLPNGGRQHSAHIPDSIAFGLDEDEDITETEGDYSLISQSYSAVEEELYGDGEYVEISHHSTPARRSFGSFLRSPTPKEGSARSRRTTASAPNRRQRHSLDSPHQKVRGRNSDFVSSYTTSRRGSSNMSPTRTQRHSGVSPALPPRRSSTEYSPTRKPLRRSSTEYSPIRQSPRRSSTEFYSPGTRPPSCRRRESVESRSDSYHARPTSMRGSNSSPTRPPSCRRRDSVESRPDSYHGRPTSMRTSPTRTSPTRPPSCRRRDSTESYQRPTSKRASTGSAARSSSPLPPHRPVSGRHHSEPLSPVRNNNPKPKANLSPKRPTTNRGKADLSPKRPKSSNKSKDVSPVAPYGHSLKLFKKHISS